MSTVERKQSISSIASSSSVGLSHPQNVGPWKLGRTLGRGATGQVLLGTNGETGQKAAVKVVSKADLVEDEASKKLVESGGLPYGIEREVIIMKLLTHPNVLSLFDVWETSKALYLVLEYVEGGELFDLLVERGPLVEEEAIKYFRQIILGTAYSHALGICHRDLKPENLLLDAGLNVKLADFGMAALESNGKLLETSCGSPHYAAPEIVSGLKYSGFSSDVWSCGVILFALLFGRLPFDDENIRNLLLKVQAGIFEMPPEVSDEARDLLSKMLTVDPATRIKTDKILSHPLLNKYPIPNEDLISVKSLPHPETAFKSLGSVHNIDKQILLNLVILWPDRSEKSIVDSLLKSGPNSEKTFYALLMRYKHKQDDEEESPRKPPTFSGTEKNSIKEGSKKKRVSQISASSSRQKPFLYNYRNNRNSNPGGRVASIGESPMKKKRMSYNQSPKKSPRKNIKDSSINFSSVSRDIYNDIENSSKGTSGQSTPPSVPSKDNLARIPLAPTAEPQLNMRGSPSRNRMSMGKEEVTKNRMSRRKSLRASFQNGLKRNSITSKVLATYAKLSSDNEWEYMDKQTRRTSATFATLCDKIFNQEQYDEEEEKLVDEEEKKAKEYELLMEKERKKHEAAVKARKELEKQQKRLKRRSLLSNKKLSILVKDDANNSENEITVPSNKLSQPKRSSAKPEMRSVSEGTGRDNGDLTRQDFENIKRRSVTQPTAAKRKVSLIKRRPVSRLDPLWMAYENQEKEEESRRNQEEEVKKKNRESVVSVEDERLNLAKKQHDTGESSEDLTNGDVNNSSLDDTENHHSSKRINSTHDAGALSNDKIRKNPESSSGAPKTLISDIQIPQVTRKSRHFSNSNKRLSVLTISSTKESFKNLSSILEGRDDGKATHGMSLLRTSFADRLDKAGLPENYDEESIKNDQNSVIDFDQHLEDKRSSYYKGKLNDMNSNMSTVKRKSGIGEGDITRENKQKDGGGDSGNKRESRKHSRKDKDGQREEEDIFENIKLPDSNDQNTSSRTRLAPKNSNRPQANSMLVPDVSRMPGDRLVPELPKTRQHKEDYPKPRKETPRSFSSNGPPEQQQGRKKSFFRKLSFGSKKTMENGQLPSPADSSEPSVNEKPTAMAGFFKWLSGNRKGNVSLDLNIMHSILPREEMQGALYSLLKAWTNFGLKNLKYDTFGFSISGEISRANAFDLKSCRFKIRLIPRERNQQSDIICSKVKGSSATCETLFKEVEKVLRREGVLRY